MPPKVLILRAPGTNCDAETAFAFERAGAATERLHINRLLENPRQFADFQILCLPGGFSYGDDIAAGLYETTQELTEAAGIPSYEISNHARPGQESRHTGAPPVPATLKLK